jgi:uncharacterized protein (TIGR03790 family)
MNARPPAWLRAVGGLLLWGLACAHALAADSAAVPLQSLRVPPIAGRLLASELGLVINMADPYSVAVGSYYAQRRNIPEQHVVRVHLPVRNTLSGAELVALADQIKTTLPAQVQALALAWSRPYAVECNAITAALTLGFQPELCKQSCAPSAPSSYFNFATRQPFTDLGLRPSMLLAARSVEAAKALIDRGIASDQQLGKRGVADVQAVFVNTQDAARNVRAALYPPSGRIPALGLQIDNTAEPLTASPRVVLLQTGSARFENAPSIHWVAGALADHLTSFGGQLLDAHDQMTALDWLEAGATASYGTVSEPCNHLQKFPHPQVLLLNYLQGSTAIEAYWRSVAWPAQGLFVGEPLAAPFGR